MKTLQELQKQYYEEFRGLPSYSPIVRNNQENDAFELVVLKVLFGKNLPEFTKEHVSEFAEYIISPPDSGIDIFFQHENGDEYSFDVIQVKNQALTESELKACISGMERTIDDYCKNPQSVNSETCKAVLSNSSLDKTNKAKCVFYVVHTGNTDDFAGAEENERVITLKALDILYKNTSEYVDSDTICISSKMVYGMPEDGSGAVVCSLNGYDLACLSDIYYRTDVGRNILFGSNLRESLITVNSKPYKAMSKTILECPQNFWYYNNGITIIARDIVDKGNGSIELRRFSIVNGAQTTSALALFLKEAKKNNAQFNIECLKQVYVLARILKIPDEMMRQEIAIYTNTQTPITTRD
ncbi:MAG: AIPR family protein, partial [Clostridia bacterium]|nr:AIPR family protein [Clostridia bacterium]